MFTAVKMVLFVNNRLVQPFFSLVPNKLEFKFLLDIFFLTHNSAFNKVFERKSRFLSHRHNWAKICTCWIYLKFTSLCNIIISEIQLVNSFLRDWVTMTCGKRQNATHFR